MPIPTNAMVAEAKKGLAWREEFNRGGTEVGVARARDIINKSDLSDDTIGRMVSFFARHEVDKQAEGFRAGEDGFPSAGRIAWALWGGDPGKSWAEKEFEMIQENRAAPDALKVGDFVSWNSSGGAARGKITRTTSNGTLEVPNSSFSVTGTEDDPAALIRLYRDGESTDTIVGHKFSTLRKIADINEKSASVLSDNSLVARKQILLDCVNLKFADASTGKFGGYASTFGGIDSYNDTIMPGAYKSVIKGIMNGSARMPKMFVNHKSYEVPIGKWTKMYEDEKGLYIEGELTSGNPEAAIVKAAMQHETIDGLSIGYMLKPNDVEFSEIDGKTVRVIKNISNLSEVSVVTFPADDYARVDLSSVKSALENVNNIREFEEFLRDAGGFSKSLATATASRAKRLFAQSESEKLILPEDIQQLIAENLKQSQAL